MAEREESADAQAQDEGVVAGAAALADPGRWSDLGVRMASGAAMAVLGAAAVMMGGLALCLLVTPRLRGHPPVGPSLG